MKCSSTRAASNTSMAPAPRGCLTVSARQSLPYAVEAH
jgi:hypothetical protein